MGHSSYFTVFTRLKMASHGSNCNQIKFSPAHFQWGYWRKSVAFILMLLLKKISIKEHGLLSQYKETAMVHGTKESGKRKSGVWARSSCTLIGHFTYFLDSHYEVEFVAFKPAVQSSPMMFRLWWNWLWWDNCDGCHQFGNYLCNQVNHSPNEYAWLDCSRGLVASGCKQNSKQNWRRLRFSGSEKNLVIIISRCLRTKVSGDLTVYLLFI